MKKRHFILVELLICIAILAICAIPLVGYPYFSFKKQKESLLKIEKQRQAEILFYDLLKSIQEKYPWDSIDRQYSKSKDDKKTLHLNIEGIGNVTLKAHYHLYHCHPDKHEKENKSIRKIWCGICFEDSKKPCSFEKNKTYPYRFVFFAKKLEEKTANEPKED